MFFLLRMFLVLNLSLMRSQKRPYVLVDRTTPKAICSLHVFVHVHERGYKLLLLRNFAPGYSFRYHSI
jgi:hypothetical protein